MTKNNTDELKKRIDHLRNRLINIAFLIANATGDNSADMQPIYFLVTQNAGQQTPGVTKKENEIEWT